MPAKLANVASAEVPENRPKLRYNNGKKRLTGGFATSTRTREAGCTETAENCGSAASGTHRAIKERILSPTPTDAPAAQSGPKKGAFRRGRHSTALRLSECRNIIDAAVFTAQKHRPLNRHTTIHFEVAGIGDPMAALRSYMKLARDWLRTQGAPFAYVWVRESGERKGEHAHILMHVPARLVAQFARRERGWRKRIGARRALGAFRSTPVGRSYRHAEAGIQYGISYADELAEIVGYVLKGAEPRAVKALGLGRVARGGEL